MVAAAAIRADAALATANEADFSRLLPHGLHFAEPGVRS
jgi:predicted nucleic acid-binding protein